MNESAHTVDLTNLGFIGYGSASLLFLVFTLLLLTSWRGRLQGGLLVLVSLVSVFWAGLCAAQAGFRILPSHLLFALEALRDLFLLGFLIRLLEMLAEGKTRRKQYLTRLRVVILGVCLLLLVPFEDWSVLLRDAPGVGIGDVRLVLHVLLSVAGLALVEQVYRNTPWEYRWGIKYLCVGVGAIFACDFYLYSDALLFHRLDATIWQARGAVNALVVPLLGVSAARNPQWSLDFFISRKIVFHSTAIFAAGAYLLVMAMVGYYIRLYGGEWSSVLQTVFFFGAGMVLLVLFFSGQFRSRLRVFINKNFFSYKYDYREEWLRLISVLSGKELQASLAERVIFAMAEMVDSSGGGLWLKVAEDSYRFQAAWNLPEEMFQGERELGSLIPYLEETQWVINLDEYSKDPEAYDGLELPRWLFESGGLWLIVPLFHEAEMLGFMLMGKSRAPQQTNWETTDLLKTAGRQVASYLELERTATALAEARQFEGFNRLSAFVMHDLKNIIAQLSLVAKNAERHKSNPEFIDDALLTVRNSVDRMTRLMTQLRSAIPGSRSDRIQLAAMLEQVVRERGVQEPAPRLEGLPAREVVVYADRDRLAAVIGHVVQNAQDAVSTKGEVVVRLKTGQGQARVEVQDNGVGMDREFIKNRLFKPFDSTKGLTGMGIGAYECREFVHSLGGQVGVSSAPGEGTLFTIYIPMAMETEH